MIRSIILETHGHSRSLTRRSLLGTVDLRSIQASKTKYCRVAAETSSGDRAVPLIRCVLQSFPQLLRAHVRGHACRTERRVLSFCDWHLRSQGVCGAEFWGAKRPKTLKHHPERPEHLKTLPNWSRRMNTP